MAWTEDLPPDKTGIVKVRGIYRLADGSKRSQVFVHKRGAYRWASAQEQKVIEGSRRDPSKGRMRWGDWCDRWWPTRSLEAGTMRSQVTLRDQHVKPRWKDVPLNEIEHADIQVWINKLAKSPNLSASTVRQCYYQLSRSMKDAIRANIIDHSPCYAVTLPTLPPAPERYFTADEVELILARMSGPYWVLTTILLETGLRLGEAVGLHRHRLDFDRGTIDVVEKWNQYDRVIESYPKGKKRRTIPMSRHLHTVLLQSSNSARKCGFTHAKGSVCRSELVVVGPKGAVIDPHNFNNVTWKRALARAEVGHARVHDCRHTYASRLVTAGVSLARVQYLLGHESITTTQRYSHLQDDGHDEVRAALAGSRNPSAPFLPHDLVADQ